MTKSLTTEKSISQKAQCTRKEPRQSDLGQNIEASFSKQKDMLDYQAIKEKENTHKKKKPLTDSGGLESGMPALGIEV